MVVALGTIESCVIVLELVWVRNVNCHQILVRTEIFNSNSHVTAFEVCFYHQSVANIQHSKSNFICCTHGNLNLP